MSSYLPAAPVPGPVLVGSLLPSRWAGWAARESTRVTSGRGAEIRQASLDYVTRLFYADQVEQAWQAGESALDRVASLAAHLAARSWIFHQVCAFEMGGLEGFLDGLPTPAESTPAESTAADPTALARRWVPARMGGFRVSGRSRGAVVLTDLASGRCLTAVDLGLRDVPVGAWVVGRLVASGTTPDLLFESHPVVVDVATARAVASGSLPGSWVTAVKQGIRAGRVERRAFESEPG